MSTHSEKLDRVIKVGLEVSTVKDVDVLMEKILTEARALTRADAGSIYIKEDDRLRFSYTQNETLRQRMGAGRKLPYNTFAIPINNRSVAGYVAFTGEILNLANVYQMPTNVPYAFDGKYDELSGYHTQSVLTVPLTDNRSDVIGVIQLINSRDDSGKIVPFDEEDIPLINHFANNAAVAIERAQMTRMTVLRMIRMAELRDPHETGPHANRVASYAMEIFETWATGKAMPEKDIHSLKDILKVAAILHDVGKVAISDNILKKPGKLTEEEYDSMKTHTILGAKLFADGKSELDQAAASVALNHHERWDGNGYPGHVDLQTGESVYTNGKAHKGKVGHEIPVFGRVVAVADVYDALSSRRSYKAAWSEEEVVNELKRASGTQFDPEMIEALLGSLEEMREVAKRYPY